MSGTLTKNFEQFFCIKTANHSKKHEKLLLARNKVDFFPSLTNSCQTEEVDLKYFLVMKTKFIISIGNLVPVKRKSSLIRRIFQQDFSSQINVQILA